jgi:hypothetical protein
MDELEAAALAKEFPDDLGLKPLAKKDKDGNHVDVTADQALEAQSQNFKMTLPTYNGEEPTDDLGMPIDKKVADAKFHAKATKGDNVTVAGENGGAPVTFRIGDL